MQTEAELSGKRADMLRKVRALIAKADSTPEPGEADVFRAGADRLMEQFAIEMWMVEAAADSSARQPVSKPYDMEWWYEHPFRHDLWALMNAVAYQTRTITLARTWERGSIKIIGLEADIDYFDMLFTHLMLEMGRRLLPHVDPSKSAEENAYELRIRHLGWPEVAWELSRAGMMEFPDGYQNRKYDQMPLDVAQKWRRRARKLYRDHCRIHGLTPESSKQPGVSAKSYAEGWCAQIKLRMRANAKVREDTYKGTGVEVALRDIRAVVAEYAERMYPPPKPVESTAAAPTRRSRAVVQKPAPFDQDAYRRGVDDAKDVDIAMNPHSRVPNNPTPLTAGTED